MEMKLKTRLKADSIIRQNLSSTDIKWYASEEEKDFVFLNKNGSFQYA